MSKIAFVFPGQGSQYVGMGKSFFSEFSQELSPLKEAVDRICGEDFLKLMWEGPDTTLNLTTNTQPALYIASAFVTQILKAKGYTPDFVAGHSLGEYSALYCAGVFDFETGLNLVKRRGQLMEKAMPAGTGSMAAVMGLDIPKIEQICKEAGNVDVANYNNDMQIIISGEKQAILKAIDALKSAGAKRVMELNVSGPFHSSLMKPAATEFSQDLDSASFTDSIIPVIANVSALEEFKAVEVKQNLVKQLYSSVLWMQSIKVLLAQGVDTFVECGSGKVLTGIIKRISSEAKLFSLDKVEDLAVFYNELNNSLK